jgi:hypothetical protein
MMSPVPGARPDGAGADVSASIWAVRGAFARGARLLRSQALPGPDAIQRDFALFAKAADTLQHCPGFGDR